MYAYAVHGRTCLKGPATQVLDVGQVVAGNFCGALLAYFGADVIKVLYSKAWTSPTTHWVHAI